MARVWVTGLGFITSVGNHSDSVAASLRELRHGIECYPPFAAADIPVKVAGTIKEFDTLSTDPEDWDYPQQYRLRREDIRGMAPQGLYAHCALLQAIEHAGLAPELVSDTATGLFTASAGSPKMTYNQMDRMKRLGVMRCPPMGIVSSVAGTLSFNLVAIHKIIGASAGFVSACASSAHALGYAWDAISLGRQERVFVVGAEDGDMESILPFAGMRALSTSDDPDTASRPFDRQRNGFVGTGGAVAMLLESEQSAVNRGTVPLAEMIGWGQSADGHNVAISHPDGEGLVRALENTLRQSGISAEQVDYINAHAPSTPIGDLSEIRALKRVFAGCSPRISSTKALTGHGLSMASVMEAAFTVLGMHGGFTVGSAHISQLEPEAEGLDIIRETLAEAPRVALSNSSGFGGANVVLAFRAC